MGGDSLEKRLIANEKEIAAAAGRDDIAALNMLIDEDFCEVGASGKRYDKNAVLTALGQMKVLETKFDDCKVVFLDDRYAIVSYVCTIRRIIAGKQQSSRAQRASLWIQRKGMWRVLFHHAASLP